MATRPATTIVDSSGNTWYLEDGRLREAEVIVEWHFISAGLVPFRKGLIDPMQFVALFPPFKPGEFGV
jgi:hypothetical protein